MRMPEPVRIDQDVRVHQRKVLACLADSDPRVASDSGIFAVLLADARAVAV